MESVYVCTIKRESLARRKLGEYGESSLICQTKTIQISIYSYILLAESIYLPNFFHQILKTSKKCVSPDSLVHLKFYDSVFSHLLEKLPVLLNCLIKCTLSQVPIAKVC